MIRASRARFAQGREAGACDSGRRSEHRPAGAEARRDAGPGKVVQAMSSEGRWVVMPSLDIPPVRRRPLFAFFG